VLKITDDCSSCSPELTFTADEVLAAAAEAGDYKIYTISHHRYHVLMKEKNQEK